MANLPWTYALALVPLAWLTGASEGTEGTVFLWVGIAVGISIQEAAPLLNGDFINT